MSSYLRRQNACYDDVGEMGNRKGEVGGASSFASVLNLVRKPVCKPWSLFHGKQRVSLMIIYIRRG